MPRGRKKMTIQTLTEELAETDSRISHCKQQLADLKARKKSLCSAIEKLEMESLYAAVKASGKTPGEWLNYIDSGYI